MQILDLTHKLQDGMAVYPGDPSPSLKQTSFIKTEGFSDFQLTTAMHAGTHMDAPAHMIEGGKKISEMDAERFFCRGVAVDARGRTELGPELLVGHDITPETAIIFYTGWAEKFGKDDYYKNFPMVSEALAKQLCVDRPSMILLDTPSPDKEPYALHKLLFNKEILIVENLKSPPEILEWDKFYVAALPLNLEADASPCRVLAVRI